MLQTIIKLSISNKAQTYSDANKIIEIMDMLRNTLQYICTGFMVKCAQMCFVLLVTDLDKTGRMVQAPVTGQRSCRRSITGHCDCNVIMMSFIFNVNTTLYVSCVLQSIHKKLLQVPLIHMCTVSETHNEFRQ